MTPPSYSRALLLLVVLQASACVSSAAPTPAAEPKVAAQAEPPCDAYTKRLCEALGEKTEPCRALHSVREWLPDGACSAGLAQIDQSLAKVAELRKDCDALTVRLCGALGEQSVTCEEVKRDLPEVPPGQCRTLLQHYPELLAQLHEREARTQPLAEEQWRALLSGNPPAFGPENAKVTIVEFSDFQCPYCAQASETVKRIREKYGDKVRFVFRQFPLSFHQNAHNAAEASLAAHAQGKFWQYHDRLFQHQSALDRKNLETYAQEVGLDVAAFKRGLDDGSFDKQIDADLELARAAKVDGTPTMFINQQRAPNPTEFDAVAPIIDAALATN
ncbi:MAG TPA: thioredoxin domain-containing protein [Polyangiales bacterium]|nr:thioredoxin domain-containing protein [Polyangiales bacterium]